VPGGSGSAVHAPQVKPAHFAGQSFCTVGAPQSETCAKRHYLVPTAPKDRRAYLEVIARERVGGERCVEEGSQHDNVRAAHLVLRCSAQRHQQHTLSEAVMLKSSELLFSTPFRARGGGNRGRCSGSNGLPATGGAQSGSIIQKQEETSRPRARSLELTPTVRLLLLLLLLLPLLLLPKLPACC